MSQRANLLVLLSGKSSILLDFDGPVCSIFANQPVPGVATSRRAVIAATGLMIPLAIQAERDPLEEGSAALDAAQVAVATRIRSIYLAAAPRQALQLEA
jgi:hypothetical protein